MPSVMSVWLIVGGFVALVWLIRAVSLGNIIRKRCVLTERSFDKSVDPAPRVSVIVAAKDEEAVIERCVRSLLAQDYPNFELIAVNDRSTDRTADILSRLEQDSGGRLRVLHIRELPQGWLGKCHAVTQGVREANGEWLYFTDADCTYNSPRTLTLAIQEAQAHRVDFLSIMPLHEFRATWEYIIQPVCSVVMALWFLPTKVNNPSSTIAYANGASMLMRRECYEALGGHEAVRTALNEDILLALHAKRAGFSLRVVENDELYKVRMYPTPRDAWRGWSRIFFGCLGLIHRLEVSAIFLFLFSLLPWLSLGYCLAVRAFGGWGNDSSFQWQTTTLIWSTAIVLQLMVIFRFYGLIKISRWWVPTYPLGAAATFGMLLNALSKSYGLTSTQWRGTVYHRTGGETMQSRTIDEVNMRRAPAITIPEAPTHG